MFCFVFVFAWLIQDMVLGPICRKCKARILGTNVKSDATLHIRCVCVCVCVCVRGGPSNIMYQEIQLVISLIPLPVPSVTILQRFLQLEKQSECFRIWTYITTFFRYLHLSGVSSGRENKILSIWEIKIACTRSMCFELVLVLSLFPPPSHLNRDEWGWSWGITNAEFTE